MDIYGRFDCNKVLELLDDVEERKDIQNNGILYLSALRACAELKSLERINRIHGAIQMDADMVNDEKLLNALITAYGKCEDILSAQAVFDGMHQNQRTVVTHSAMMKAMEYNGFYAETVRLFEAMEKDNNIELDEICYLLVLTACSKDHDLYEYGTKIVKKLESSSLSSSWQIQTQCLVHYGTVGDLESAERLFYDGISNEVKSKEVSVWNAMLQILAKNGMARNALQLYHAMEAEHGLKGDDVTKLVVLNGCSHCGLTEEAKAIFDEYVEAQSGGNAKEIYAAMTDCYARRGYLKEAADIIEEFEEQGYPPNYVMWMALLNGCRVYGDKKMANKVSDAFQLRFKNAEISDPANVFKSASLLSEHTA